jgi:hypothetical protein
MRVRRLLLSATLATATLGAAGAYLLRDPLLRFLARRSSLVTVTDGPPMLDRGYEIQQVRTAATSGLAGA